MKRANESGGGRPAKRQKGAEAVFYGERSCEQKKKSSGEPCSNKAYYRVGNGSLACGQHSSKKKGRTELPQMSAEQKAHHQRQRMDAHMATVEEAAKANRDAGKRGTVTCEQMRLFRNPPLHPGVLNVFPNYKHQNRTDGFGCSSLSPKSIGPVNHKQPGLPKALTIENLHQGNKVFPFFLSDDGKTPSTGFYAVRLAMYKDKTPWRHQHDFLQAHPKMLPKGIEVPKVKVNAPAFSVWVGVDGKEHHFSYVESRQFYCHFYEVMAKELADYKELERKLDQGYNLNICGYDAYQPTRPLEEHYLDPSRPFGHELVLYSCLMHQHPWHNHRSRDVW